MLKEGLQVFYVFISASIIYLSKVGGKVIFPFYLHLPLVKVNPRSRLLHRRVLAVKNERYHLEFQSLPSRAGLPELCRRGGIIRCQRVSAYHRLQKYLKMLVLISE